MNLVDTNVKPLINVYIFNHMDNKKHEVTAMIDTGSDSFVWCGEEVELGEFGFIDEHETTQLIGLNDNKDKSKIPISKIYSGTIFFVDCVNENMKIVLPKVKVAVSSTQKELYDMIIPYTFLNQFDCVFKSKFKEARFGSFGIFTFSDKFVYDVKQSKALVTEVNVCDTIPEEVKGLLR